MDLDADDGALPRGRRGAADGGSGNGIGGNADGGTGGGAGAGNAYGDGHGVERQLALRARRPPEMNEIHYDTEVRKFGKRDGSEVVSGRWSKEEDDRLRMVVREFVESKGSSLDEYRESLRVESRTEHRPNTKHFKGLWVHCATFFPRRTVESIRCRGERIFHPSFKKGAWNEEEIAELKTLVAQHGRRWVKIGALLDREPGSVRDKFRQVGEQTSGCSKPVSARWSRADEERLIELVKEAVPEWKAGNVPLHGIPWKEIGAKMGRNKTAVMEKWHANLHGKVVGYKVRNWGYPEFGELIKAIRFTNATEYDQVPWEDLPVRFSPAVCRRQWRSLVKRKGLEDETFSAQIGILTLEYAPNLADKAMRQAASKSRRKRRHGSKRSKRKQQAAAEAEAAEAAATEMGDGEGAASDPEDGLQDTPSSPEPMSATENADYVQRSVPVPVSVAPMTIAQQANLIMDSEDEEEEDGVGVGVGRPKRKLDGYLENDHVLEQDPLKHSRRDIAAMDPHATAASLPPPNSHDANISI